MCSAPGHEISLQLEATALPDLVGACSQSREERRQFGSNTGGGAPACIGRHLGACPFPDRFVGSIVRAVGWQGHQPQPEVRRGEIRAQLLSTMGRRVVPDHDERLGVAGTQLLEQGDTGRGAAGAHQLHDLQRPGFQTDRRVVRGLLRPSRAGRGRQGWCATWRPQPGQLGISTQVGFVHEHDRGASLLGSADKIRVRAHEGSPLVRIGLDELLLGTLAHEVEPVQLAQTAAAAHGLIELLAHELADRLPGPGGGWDAGLTWWLPHRCGEGRLLLRIQGGGEPPLCAKALPAGPWVRKHRSQSPIVCASRSSARATRAALQPWLASHSACQRSRSRAVDARYIWSRAMASSRPHDDSRQDSAGVAGSSTHADKRTHPRRFYDHVGFTWASV